ncbi:YhjD/YihY/BrkB family envelope integrity protein, partial [Streptomyces sp. NPDC005486]|uniref:YhjD/YihY/BrkB family envelope integrity protein n=1 Tax=Streptomyces sp. NPDC005486 TaxID=3155345 RepID=UPI0033B1A8DD
MVRTLKRHGRHGGRVADERENERENERGDERENTRVTDTAGPDEQVERRAPDSPTKLPKRSWKAVLKGTLKEFKKDELTDRAAGLTYYGILALFPALLALVSLLGIVGQSATQQVLDNIQKLAPGPGGGVVGQAGDQVDGGGGRGWGMWVVGGV